jgi:hypothetical protein
MSASKIMGVAVKYGELMVCLPAPKRHADCIRVIYTKLGVDGRHGVPADNQGFYDDAGRFLTRRQAWQQAHLAGQNILPSPVDGHVNTSGILFSEDLWL